MYKNPSNALQVHVDEEDKTSYLIQVSGSTYKANTLVINESGLYSLILSSKLPTAKAFKRWVTAEVLPQIRKTGGYIPTHDAEGRQLSNVYTAALGFAACHRRDARRYSSTAEGEVNRPRV